MNLKDTIILASSVSMIAVCAIVYSHYASSDPLPQTSESAPAPPKQKKVTPPPVVVSHDTAYVPAAKPTRKSPSEFNPTETKNNITSILAYDNPVTRTRALQNLIDQTPIEKFPELHALLDAQSTHYKFYSDKDLLTYVWVKADPEAALKHLNDKKSNIDTGTALIYWAKNDPTEAAKWLSAVEDPVMSDTFRTRLAPAVARENPELAAVLISEVSDSTSRSNLAADIVATLSTQDTTTSLRFLDDLHGTDYGFAAASKFLTVAMDTNPEQIANWTAKPEQKQFRASMIRGSLMGWTKLDPDKAIQWHQTLDPKTQAETAYGIAEPLASKNIDKALAWIAPHTDEPAYDLAKIAIARKQYKTNPQAAKATLQNIANSNSERAKDAKFALRRLGVR